MTHEYMTEKRLIGRYVVELGFHPDGGVLIRTPEIYPPAARRWRGPYESVEAAVGEFSAFTAVPRVTSAELARLRERGAVAEICGKDVMVWHCPWREATTLSEFVLVREDGNA